MPTRFILLAHTTARQGPGHLLLRSPPSPPDNARALRALLLPTNTTWAPLESRRAKAQPIPSSDTLPGVPPTSPQPSRGAPRVTIAQPAQGAPRVTTAQPSQGHQACGVLCVCSGCSGLGSLVRLGPLTAALYLSGQAAPPPLSSQCAEHNPSASHSLTHSQGQQCHDTDRAARWDLAVPRHCPRGQDQTHIGKASQGGQAAHPEGSAEAEKPKGPWDPGNASAPKSATTRLGSSSLSIRLLP